ncbi:MAG TPA: glycosyltransferase [Actinobacteria bacterium]|nr:capsular glucan synthase [bacterium BMS3Bbin01]HDH26694.1 glycosyltransferase [Actinomycetota bacterium]
MKDRPRILVALKGLAIGGAEKLVLDQARHWDREVFDYRVAYLAGDLDELAGGFRELGVPVHSPRQGGALNPRVLSRFAGEVRDMAPDIIHAHLPIPGIVVRSLPGTKASIVYTEHNLPSHYRLASRLANRLTYGRNDAVICVSDAVREAVGSYRCRRVATVANAIGPPHLTRRSGEIRREFDVGTSSKLVTHIGNIREGKGHRNLIHAVAMLRELRDDVILVSAGAEQVPGELSRLRQMAFGLGLGENLRFLGQRSDAPDLMNAADVVVNPSDVEGLPIALLEAMHLGKPVVATAVGGVGSLIEDGVTGLLVPPGRPGCLGEAVDRLLSDPVFARHLGEAGRRRVLSQFSIEGAVRRIEDVYRSVILDKQEHSA